MSIAGTLPMIHDVDASGSCTLIVPLRSPECRFKPDLSLTYHSASTRLSILGKGWALRGAPIIERIPATMAQDGFSGAVGYNEKDRFALDGQRLIRIDNAPKDNKTEYRFEIEQWSRFFAIGSDIANPSSWEQHLPDGTVRKFGDTVDSNVKGVGIPYTRVWAISDASDSFTNYITLKYINESQGPHPSGAFYLSEISYGGNRQLNLGCQRQLTFQYHLREDIVSEYLGSSLIRMDRRLESIRCSVKNVIMRRYEFGFDYAPLTGVTRITSIALVDKSGSKVEPLKFDWSSGDLKVFDPIKDVATLPLAGKDLRFIPMDVNASGRSDVVIATTRPNPAHSDKEELYLDVYLCEPSGLSNTPTSESGFSGLFPPTQLLPFDANGDGQTDLLHIVLSEDSYSITILLSDGQGFKAQQTALFKPKSLGGTFQMGDFKGDGQIELVYIYSTLVADYRQLRFVQFTSNGTVLKPGDSDQEGPILKEGVKFKDIRVIVGDFDGNGTDDIFIVSPQSARNPNNWIDVIQSNSGTLKYDWGGNRLRKGEVTVSLDLTTSILPFRAEYDGKTSLLLVSNQGEKLEFQLLRSVGTFFLADQRATVTNVKYGGNVSVARVVSPDTSDIVNIVDGVTGPTIDIFHFDGKTFKHIPNTTQPTDIPQGSLVHWADFRGNGRSDCLFNTFDSTQKIYVRGLNCSGFQPPDRITVATNGLGASTVVSYAPLTDPSVYRFTKSAGRQPAALMNGLANRSISMASLTSTTTRLQATEFSRSKLVYYPNFVVKDVTTFPQHPSYTSSQQFIYFYINSLLAFDGRGWLGFEKIAKKATGVDIIDETNYLQTFPFLGQISLLQKADDTNTSLSKTSYTWDNKHINSGKNYAVLLKDVKEIYYEDKAEAYQVNISFARDDYANITRTSIDSTQPGSAVLSIESTYESPNFQGPWVVGNKKTEDTKQNQVSLRRVKRQYRPGSAVCTSTSNWIRDDIWSSTVSTFDKAGNTVDIQGPFSSHQEFTYDSTFSTVISTKTHTSSTNSVVEISSFDLATSLPLDIEKPNGVITQFKYDVLGRTIQVSQGTDRTQLDMMETTTFSMQGSKLVETRSINNGLAGPDKSLRKVITHYDGLQRPLLTQKSRPDDLAAYICVESQYDGLGRLIARSREYQSGSQARFFRYSYDKHSRLIKEAYPGEGSDPGVIRQLQYSCQLGIPKISESFSGDHPTNNQHTTRELIIIPNADAPSLGNFVKLCVAKRTDEIGQTISTTFDGLARPITITDPAGVELLLNYDGLSREIEKEIKTGGQKPVTFSHFRLIINDDQHRSEVRNILTGKSIITRTDFCRRLLLKVTSDETLTFEYDKDKFSRGRLSSVMSSKQTVHRFDYDTRGNHKSTTLEIDGRTLHTKFSWTATGQLEKTTNPDGTSISQNYFPDGLTIKKLELSGKDGIVKASTTFSNLGNAYALPLTQSFGNGVTSKASIFDSGMLGDEILSKGTQTLLKQTWSYDDFNKIATHKIDKGMTATYGYDLAGQVTTESVLGGIQNTVKYDNSGNIKQRGADAFTNDGWQLKSVKDPSGPLTSYEYTVDGNMREKKTGGTTNTMTYDDQGRLSTIDHTTFHYDYAGRLLKATKAAGDNVTYASPTYEIEVDKDGKEIWTSYMLDNGQRRASLNSVGVAYYFHPDHLGSTIAVSNSNGTIVTQYTYDALGKVSLIKGADVARYKYCGKELFQASIYYFGSRFYDPKIGRFLTLDDYSIDMDNISPSCFNLYLFSRNDPINFVDVNGNGPVPWWHWAVDVGLILGGLTYTIIGGLSGNPFSIIIGGALLGAGMTGLMTDIEAALTDENDNKAWVIQLGLGATFGGATAALGLGLNFGISQLSKPLLSTTSREVFKNAGVKTLFHVGADAGLSAGSGALQQIVANSILGKPGDSPYKNVLSSAILGGLGGFIIAGGFFAGASRMGRLASRAQSVADRAMSLQSLRSGLPNLRAQLAQGRLTNSPFTRNMPLEVHYIARGMHFANIDD